MRLLQWFAYWWNNPQICPLVQKRMPLFVRKELAPDEQQSVFEHLLVCPDCRKEENLERGLQGLSPLSSPAASRLFRLCGRS